MKNSIKSYFYKSANLKAGFIALMLLFSVQYGFGQKYVTSTDSDHNNSILNLATASVTDPNNALSAPNGTSAVLSASGINAAGVGIVSSDATLTLTFDTPIPIGKRAFIRISNISQTGLSINLQSVLTVLGLFSNQTIKATANAGTTEYKLVKDPSNNLFMEVTSTSAFSSIDVNLNFGKSVGLLQDIDLGRINLSIEHAVTYENSIFTPCESLPFAFVGTNPDATGISLTLTDALQDPEKAIDGIVSASNYSLLQNGTVAGVSSVSQTVYLGKTVPATNEVIATISRPGATLANLDVLANITIQAFSGASAIGQPKTIQSALLELTLLTSFTNNELVTISFVPIAAYDRIVITSNTTLGANLFTGLRIHEVGSRPPVTFTGGLVAGTQAGTALNSNIVNATATTIPVVLPGFSIGCGASSSFTYKLFNVTQNARVMAGSLPNTLTLLPNGTLQGNTTTAQQGTYTFDVEASNVFGQKKVAQFVITISSALPVTLVSFNAKAEGQTATLDWSTSAETNSDRFNIERSRNGKTWLEIGNVSSNHESLTLKRYFFTDANPLDGENLYRLKMIDADGTYAYSHIESLNFNSKSIVNLYPNPVVSSENLQISVKDWGKIESVRIINAVGKIVFESANSLITGINTGNLTSGLYVVQIIQKDGKIDTSKFVKL